MQDLIKTAEASAEKGEIKFEHTNEQDNAISHTGSDLLLSAGAGSGKTATLTDRIVESITGDKKMDISRMLVVTFTTDAANELKVRIAKKLSEKLKNDPKNPHLCDQFIKVTSADISTIHSFCFKCIRPYLDRLNLDSDVRIGEENELSLLRLEAMNEVIDEFYEADTVDPDFLLVVDCYSSYTDDSLLSLSLLDLYTKKLSSCAEGIDILLKKQDTGADFLSTGHGQVLTKYVYRIVKHYLPLIKDLYVEACSDDNNKKYVKNLEELERVYSQLELELKHPTYEGVKKILCDYAPKAASGGKRDAVPTFYKAYVDYIRNGAHAELVSLRDEYFYSTAPAIKSTFEQNEKICLAIHKVLSAYEEKYKEKKRKYALCDFDDLEKLTLVLLYDENGKASDIAREISYMYDEVYIDEYQDVNPIQDKIFQAISRNNRFMVGDIKQSIYGFRSAEPALFSNYRDTFISDESIRLKEQGRTIFMSDNFRCDPSVISLTNHISDYMFLNSHGFSYVPEGDRLKPSKMHGKVFNPQNAELCIINSSKIDKDSFLKELEPQAEFVAQEIRRLLDTGYLPNGEKIEPKHIAILLKKYKGKADKYIDALNKYGIKHEFVQEISFFEKPHILLLLSILNAIDNPSKDVYLTGALHSHIFNISLDELVAIKRFSPPEYSLFSAINNFGGNSTLREKIDGILNTISAFQEAIRGMSACEAVSFVMNKTGFVSSCNKEERQDVIKLYNMARSYENGSYKGLYSFLRHIDSISAKGTIAETVSHDPENSVKILSMHKSKGLEYEICFLCDLEKGYFSSINKSSILFNRRLGICGYVSRDGGIVKYDNLVRKCIDLATEDEEREEAMRLLYVAMTRARSKLYLTAAVPALDEKRKKAKCLYDTTDDYMLYSHNSHIGLIMGACPFPLEFLEVDYSVEDKIYRLDDNSKGDTEKGASCVDELKNILLKRFNSVYPYGQLGKIPSKLSISTLHPTVLDDEDNQEYHKSYTIDALPKFALDKKEYVTGADRGTATHTFLQFCDFDNLKENGVESELTRLLDNSFISANDKEIINKDHIEKFISSEMMGEFLRAKRIIREFRFNVMLPACEFSDDERITNETVLVQGVTDCIYENEKGELILVDYKTDKVTEENYISELTRKHKTQLTYYKRACELMFERPVSKVLIYSVPLAKVVEIV